MTKAGLAMPDNLKVIIIPTVSSARTDYSNTFVSQNNTEVEILLNSFMLKERFNYCLLMFISFSLSNETQETVEK